MAGSWEKSLILNAKTDCDDMGAPGFTRVGESELRRCSQTADPGPCTRTFHPPIHCAVSSPLWVLGHQCSQW